MTTTLDRPTTPTASAAPQPPSWCGVLSGLLAAAVALGVGELVAGLVPGGRGPVVVVGDAVIDLVPSAVKELAIDLFGTADKIALIVGILVILAVVAAGIGVLALRRLRIGLLGIALFGAVGVLAAASNALGQPVAAVIPSIAAGLAGVVALWLLVRALTRPTAHPPARPPCRPPAQDRAQGQAQAGLYRTDRQSPPVGRRAFLRTTGVLAGVALAAGATGRALVERANAAASRAVLALTPPADPAPPVPPAADVDVEGVVPWLTPNPDFYRIDTALQVPRVAVDTWTLTVRGMVDRELTLNFEDLNSRPLLERYITLTCVSNEVGGNLIGNARWLGVSLAEVLNEAGVDPAATQIVGRSVDGFACGFPVEAAFDGRDALIAIGMNGEPLPPEHGYPARLVVPGLYGYVSATKWLQEIELTTFEAFDHYWVERGWAVEGPIKTQSRIDVPRGFASPPAGPVTVAGVAWAQTRGIDRVEVQVDDGPWQEARLAAPVNDVTWRQWAYDWDATPGNHQVRCRATDGNGETQTEERVAPIPDGASGWHSVFVRVAEA